MKIDGACLCQQVRYEATIDPGAIVVCHCSDCQINGGGAFRWGTLVPREQFALTSGTLKFYHKTAASGRRRALAFCPDCGTSLYGTEADDSKVYSLRLSTAHQARELTPSLQIWQSSACAWLGQLDAIPGMAQQPWGQGSPDQLFACD